MGTRPEVSGTSGTYDDRMLFAPPTSPTGTGIEIEVFRWQRDDEHGTDEYGAEAGSCRDHGGTR